MVNNGELTGWRILIVDDDLDNLEVACAILQLYGAQVYSAEDGREGLEQISRVAPHLVLLDLSMPTLNGWETLSEIRSNIQTAAVPVIALTAHAMLGDREHALAAGFTGYISKPFLLKTFLSEIKRCLQPAPAVSGRSA